MTHIAINDVGPRDGLQNQPRILSAEQRLRLVGALVEAGLKHIEFGSFVSPKAVPAMAGAAEMAEELRQVQDVQFTALIPNLKGYELAVAAGTQSVSMVLYGTDAMALKNAGMTARAAEDATVEILSRARRDGVAVSATIAVAFQCPYEGPVPPAVTLDLAERMLGLGLEELGVADTIGAANPQQVRDMTQSLVDQHGAERLACHFHDTRAMGLANVFAAVESGVRKFDASIAGLGGCPFAPGASGNVATEDVVMMLHQMGFETGVDLAALLRASALAQELTGTAPGGRARAWLEKNLDKEF